MRERTQGVGIVAVVALSIAVVWFSAGTGANQPREAASPGGSSVASPGASPIATPIVGIGGAGGIVVDPALSRFPVAGNAFHLLEPGTPGELSVVAHKPTSGASSMPVMVRNNTDEVQVNITVGAEARDASGNLIGATVSPPFSPNVVEPGALAMGSLFFDPPLQEDATVTFYPEGESDTALYLRFFEGYAGVELIEFSATSERILGTVRNPTAREINDVSLNIACFDAAGTFVTVEVGRPVRAKLGPGESSAFEVLTLRVMQPPCDFFLVTGQGS